MRGSRLLQAAPLSHKKNMTTENSKKELLSALDNLRNVSYKQTLLMLAFLGVIFYGDNVEKAMQIIYTLAEKTGVASAFWVFGAFVQLFFIFVAYWAYYFHECCRLWIAKKTERNDSDVKVSFIYSCISAALYLSAVVCSLAILVRVLYSTSEVVGKLFGGLFGILLMVLLPIAFLCILIRFLKGD